MSKPLTIRYLKTAEKDLDDIFSYIMRDNPSAAVSQLDKFDKSISQLSSNPFLGVVPKDQRLKELGYRILIVDRYLVFYVVKPKTVQIRHRTRQYNFLL